MQGRVSVPCRLDDQRGLPYWSGRLGPAPARWMACPAPPPPHALDLPAALPQLGDDPLSQWPVRLVSWMRAFQLAQLSQDVAPTRNGDAVLVSIPSCPKPARRTMPSQAIQVVAFGVGWATGCECQSSVGTAGLWGGSARTILTNRGARTFKAVACVELECPALCARAVAPTIPHGRARRSQARVA